MISKKDLIAIAGVFRGIKPRNVTEAFMWRWFLDSFAKMLRANNPKFDRGKFEAEVSK